MSPCNPDAYNTMLNKMFLVYNIRPVELDEVEKQKEGQTLQISSPRMRSFILQGQFCHSADPAGTTWALEKIESIFFWCKQ